MSTSTDHSPKAPNTVVEYIEATLSDLPTQIFPEIQIYGDFSNECVLLPYWKKKLMISCLRGEAQLIHTRAEEGGLGTADRKQKKMKKSKDSVHRAIKIAENANRNHAHMILDMRGQ
jgi:hypothetical protein